LVVIASSLGSVIDWYDFIIYGVLASVLAVNFFPSDDPYVGVLSTFAVFGVGYAGRPLGGILFGRMGDLIGRKSIFILSMLVVGSTTALMGLLPTYQSVGLIAPALLVSLRLLQGMGFGGEYTGAGTYVAEFSPDNRRGTYTAIANHMTNPAGTLMGTAVVLLILNSIGSAAMTIYGWRIAFLVSVLLVLLGFLLRVRITETPLFQAVKDKGKLSRKPIGDAVKANWRKIILTMFCFQGTTSILGYSSAMAVPIMFMTTLMRPPISLQLASQVTIVANVVCLPFYSLFGYISDRLRSRKKVFYSGAIVGAIMLYPLYYLIDLGGRTGNLAMMVTGVTVLAILWTASAGLVTSLWTELFPTRLRSTSYGIGNSIAVAFFGGFTPFMVAAIVSAAGGQFFVGLLWPITYALVTSIIGLRFIPETHAKLPD
jgi:MFS family permease